MVHCVFMLSILSKGNRAFKSNLFYKYLQKLQFSNERNKVSSVGSLIPDLLEKVGLVFKRVKVPDFFGRNRWKIGLKLEKIPDFHRFKKAILSICP